MKNEARCPYCGVELEEDECYDTEQCDGQMSNYLAGYCPQCEKEFQWEEIYIFSDISCLREVT